MIYVFDFTSFFLLLFINEIFIIPEQHYPYVEHSRLWRTQNTSMSMQLWRPAAFDKAWSHNFGWPKPSCFFEIPGHASGLEMTEFKILAGISRKSHIISVFLQLFLAFFPTCVINNNFLNDVYINIIWCKMPFFPSYFSFIENKKITFALTDVFLRIILNC